MGSPTDITREVSADLRRDITRRKAELERLYIARMDELESCLPEGARTYECRCGCVARKVKDEDYIEWQFDTDHCTAGCPD